MHGGSSEPWQRPDGKGSEHSAARHSGERLTGMHRTLMQTAPASVARSGPRRFALCLPNKVYPAEQGCDVSHPNRVPRRGQGPPPFGRGGNLVLYNGRNDTSIPPAVAVD